MEREKHHYVHAYKGPTTERTTNQYSQEWVKTGLGNFDELVYEQLLFAQSHGQNKITILDIGCEKEAKLYEDFLHNPEVGKKTRHFLSEHRNMYLELVGLTDATEVETFGKTNKQLSVDENEIRGKARIVNYTLTAVQTLERFLKEQNIKSTNLVLATWSLAYLSPNVFEEVLRTASNSLQKGGRFLGSGYNDSMAGLGFGVDFNYYPDLVFLNKRNSNLTPQHWSYAMIADEELPQLTPQMNEEQLWEIKDMTRKAIKPLMKKGLLLEDDAKFVSSNLQYVRSYSSLRPLTTKLRQPLYDLREYKYQKVLKPLKDDAIRSLMGSTELDVQSDFVKNITVQRR